MTIDLRHYEAPSDNKESNQSPENRNSTRFARKTGLLLTALILLLASLYLWPARSPERVYQESRVHRESPPAGTDENITFTRGYQNHYFIQNEQTGRILVITGQARNSYSHERSFIRLRAMLLASDGHILDERYSYAGNILEDEDLKHLPLFEIVARLSIKGGQDGRNMNIKPGEKIPFMVVFDKLPDGMAEYRVDPVSSDPAANLESEAGKFDEGSTNYKNIAVD